MFIANEGKKNLEAKANFIDPRGGCGRPAERTG